MVDNPVEYGLGPEKGVFSLKKISILLRGSTGVMPSVQDFALFIELYPQSAHKSICSTFGVFFLEIVRKMLSHDVFFQNCTNLLRRFFCPSGRRLLVFARLQRHRI